MTDAERIAQLEAKIDIQAEYTHAVFDVLTQVLKDLHAKGVLKMQDVADSLEATKDFGHAAFQKKPSSLIPVIAGAIRVIGKAIDEA